MAGKTADVLVDGGDEVRLDGNNDVRSFVTSPPLLQPDNPAADILSNVDTAGVGLHDNG